MKRFLFFLSALLLLVLPGWTSRMDSSSGQTPSAVSKETAPVPWRVYFSPGGGCTDAIVDAIDRANNSILVQCYSFTSRPIGSALARARARGVVVEIVADGSEPDQFKKEINYLARSGVEVHVDSAHTLAHNKVMVIDGETVITGSFNFTYAAEHRNAENLLVIQNKTLAEQYAANWREHKKHSRPY